MNPEQVLDFLGNLEGPDPPYELPPLLSKGHSEQPLNFEKALEFLGDQGGQSGWKQGW